MLNAIVNGKNQAEYGLVYFAKPGKEKDPKILETFANASNTLSLSDIPSSKGLFMITDFHKN
jgi:hypothetical protein